MGVLGWTPQTVMIEAELRDLADAYSGYALHHKIQKEIPPEGFLQTMLENFPDKG